ncbi:hypothetical protein N9B98_03320 [bacterium]|nr:hypothetical protein [bacterium]
MMKTSIKEKLRKPWFVFEEDEGKPEFHLYEEALNYIDKLEKVVEELREDLTMAAVNVYELEAKLATCEKYRDAYDKIGRIGVKYIEELQAKLAKAVDLALEECPFIHGTGSYNDWWHDRRTTIAELKGEK